MVEILSLGWRQRLIQRIFKNQEISYSEICHAASRSLKNIRES